MNCEFYQAKTLMRSYPNSISRISIVASAIYKGYLISPEWNLNEWNCWWAEGSFTIQHNKDNFRLIKVFIDYDNVLAEKVGLSLHGDPMAVGVELSEEPRIVQKLIREYLSKSGRRLYLDPRKGNPKFYIAPQKKHCLDILFLRQGQCDGDEAIAKKIYDSFDEEKKSSGIIDIANLLQVKSYEN